MKTTTGAEQDDQISASDSVELYWRCTVYFPIIDTIVNNLKFRFPEESLEMASSIDYFVEMDYEKSQYFINHYKVCYITIQVIYVCNYNDKLLNFYLRMLCVSTWICKKRKCLF